MTTRSEKVKIFTQESMDPSKGGLPTHPRKMTREEVKFVVKMNCEELLELLYTVDNNPKNLLKEIIEDANVPTKSQPISDIDIMAEQVDAFVDIDYYNCNAACKVGFNPDAIFDIVHQANMNKKFKDGTFHRNELGKVIKPQDWKEPNINKVVKSWIKNGSW